MALLTPAFNDAKTYGFEWLRLLLDVAPVQAGVLAAGDHKITAAAAGGMRVDHAAGIAVIKATTGVRNGKAIAVNDANVANAVTLANSHATLPRIDLIYLRWRDSSDLGDAADDVIIDKVTGTPTASVTLDAPGASPGALPSNSLLLAMVLIPAASTQVTAGNVRDRRARARGARFLATRNTGNLSVPANYAGSPHDANLAPRIECSGAPVRAGFLGIVSWGGATGNFNSSLFQDGAQVGGTERIGYVGGSGFGIIAPPVEIVPAAGSHVFDMRFKTGMTALDIVAIAAQAATFTLQEDLRDSASNN